ncbi:MAG: hypothetical protein ABI353_03990 [Isosphaeraceae bacterium]
MHNRMGLRGFLAIGLVVLGSLIAGCGGSDPSVAEAPAGPGKAPGGSGASPELFVSEEGNFRVAFPDQPRSMSQTINSPVGPQKLQMYMVETSEKVTYILSYSDYPESTIRTSNPDDLLDGGVRGMGRQWDVKEQEPAKLGEHPGRSIRFEAQSAEVPGKGLGRARVYLVGGRLYQLVAVGPESKVKPESFDQFLESFQLIRDVKVLAGNGPSPAVAKVRPDRVEKGSAAELAKNSAETAPETVSDPGPDPAKPAETALDVTYDTERLTDLPGPKLGGDRESFREIAPEGGVLVGVRVGYVNAFGGSKVGAVWPVYQIGSSYRKGARFGKETEPAVTVLARPGYAVGALNTRTGLLVDGFQVVFMKVKDGRLDPQDAYQSDWLGDAKGGGAGKVSGDGRLVVGLHGKTNGQEINALGLVVAD